MAISHEAMQSKGAMRPSVGLSSAAGAGEICVLEAAFPSSQIS
jgi:hypothetical protein